MAYPPATLPSNRSNTTPQFDTHPGDHNDIARAVTDIVNELGNNPSGPEGSVQTRLAGMVKKTGDTMSGNLVMGNNLIGGLGDAEAAGNAVSRGYGDARYARNAATANTFTGPITVGNDPSAGGQGSMLAPSGVIRAGCGNSAVGIPNLICNRWGTGGAMDIGQPLVRFDRNSTPIGNITIESGTSVAYNKTCDYRMKNDLGPITDAVDRLRLLQPKRITWKATEDVPESAEQDALIAHEVTPAVPEAVSGEKDAVYGPPPMVEVPILDTDGIPTGETEIVPSPDAPPEGSIDPQQLDATHLIPLLTAALQTALDQIDALTARVTVLEA